MLILLIALMAVLTWLLRIFVKHFIGMWRGAP
jgi:hypothetical protein